MDSNSIRTELMTTTKRIHRLNIDFLLEDISQSEFIALHAIEKHTDKYGKQPTVSTLAKHLHISTPAISRTLGTLESKELILRQVDETCRRNTIVTLTEKGKAQSAAICQKMNAFMDRIFSRMGEEHVEELIQLMQEMASIMEDEIATKRKENE